MPKTINRLWADLTSFDNLFSAFTEASASKRARADVLEYASRLEENLIGAQNQLIWQTWTPGRMSEFFVFEPKKRLVQAPQFRDRVVHHALVRIIAPIFERRFIADSFACRKYRGTHAAVLRCRSFTRTARRQWAKPYVLKADISGYFPSIDHALLKARIRRAIRCKKTLWLIDKIIDGGGDNGVGIPIGALTSQLFANIYLDALDHCAKDELGLRYYLRYMDDFVVLGGDKQSLHGLLAEIRGFLHSDLHLELNPKTRIFPLSQGIDFCGYRIWPTHLLPRKRNLRRARRRLQWLAAAYSDGKYSLSEIRPFVASFLGYTQHCSAFVSTRHILRDLVFRRTRRNGPSRSKWL